MTLFVSSSSLLWFAVIEAIAFVFYRQAIKKHLWAEKWGAEAFALFTFVLALSLRQTIPEETGTTLVQTSVIACAIMAGFTGTGLCTLLGLKTSLIKQLHQSQYMKEVSAYISRSLTASFCFIVLSLYKLGYDEMYSSSVSDITGWLWFAGLAYIFLCFFRLKIILIAALANPDNVKDIT